MIERLAYSVEEAAESIGISDRKLSDLIHSAGFPLFVLVIAISFPWTACANGWKRIRGGRYNEQTK
jgi:hypothetical protein